MWIKAEGGTLFRVSSFDLLMVWPHPSCKREKNFFVIGRNHTGRICLTNKHSLEEAEALLQAISQGIRDQVNFLDVQELLRANQEAYATEGEV